MADRVRAVVKRVRTREALADALDPELDVAVFEARQVADDWDAVRDELFQLFESSRSAASEGVPIVYIVSSEALLGRTGPGNAMVATGALSAARTLAVELMKAGLPVNVIGARDDTPIEVLATWVATLATSGPDGPTGELIQLGGTQIGKALP